MIDDASATMLCCQSVILSVETLSSSECIPSLDEPVLARPRTLGHIMLSVRKEKKSRFAFSIGHLLKLSILFILFIHNLLTGSLPEHGCKKKVISRDFFLQVENILKRFDCEYLLTVTLGGNNK